MTIPLAYTIPVPGTGLQGVGSADRPLCALVSAYASYLRGEPLAGAWKTMARHEQEAAFVKRFTEFDVLFGRTVRWAESLNGKPLFISDPDPRVGTFTLDPYQMEALALLKRGGGVLALGCGLGKTATAIRAAIESDASRNRCWIVCPLNAIPAWKKWEEFLREFFSDVQILSMDSAHKFVGCENTGGVIIFDEAHLLGVCSARRTKACHQIRPMFDFGLCLTGTLLHGGVEKTLSILDLAIPGGAQFASRWKAGEHFRCIVRKSIGSRTVTALEKPVGKAKEAFLAYMSSLVVSMNSHSEIVRQSLQLPEQTIHTVKLGEPWGSLEDLAAQYVHEQIASGREELPHAQEVAHALCRQGLPAKIDWILEAIDSPDIPVVVFGAYLESLDAIGAAFDEAGITYVRVDGSVTGQDRILAMNRFQAGEVQAFLGQMDAACTSMDLFRAQFQIHVDHTWKAANYNQALARTCRRGQTQACHAFDLTANTLQARVVARLAASEDFDASLAEWQALKAKL